MYHYVTDKQYLKETYSICADIVNQLVQALKNDGIIVKMAVVGSKARGLVTQNENEPIDYDFNLNVIDAGLFRTEKDLKNQVIIAFNKVLKKNGWSDCKDSTSVISTELRELKKGNKTPFSIDICLIKVGNNGDWYRLIHQKTGTVCWDRWYWNQAPSSKDVAEKAAKLKPDYWSDVREKYIEKKNMYLTRGDKENHPSFICYVEAVNEVYNANRFYL